MDEQTLTARGEPEGTMTPLPENPMDGQEVWVKCKVRVTSSFNGYPVYWVGPEGTEWWPLECVEYRLDS